MSSFGNIMIVLDELNPAIQVNPLGEWQNLDLRVYEVEISAENNFYRHRWAIEKFYELKRKLRL